MRACRSRLVCGGLIQSVRSQPQDSLDPPGFPPPLPFHAGLPLPPSPPSFPHIDFLLIQADVSSLVGAAHGMSTNSVSPAALSALTHNLSHVCRLQQTGLPWLAVSC